jgi:hypothetical protein
VALGRWEEFRLHARAGLERELDESDLQELLMQSAIYCGVPAANTAFHHARELLEARRDATADGQGRHRLTPPGPGVRPVAAHGGCAMPVAAARQ